MNRRVNSNSATVSAIPAIIVAVLFLGCLGTDEETLDKSKVTESKPILPESPVPLSALNIKEYNMFVVCGHPAIQFGHLPESVPVYPVQSSTTIGKVLKFLGSNNGNYAH